MALFRRREKEDGNNNKQDQQDNRIIMQRENGTILVLTPALDREGNLITKEVYNRFGEICRIPKFYMSCPELQQISPQLLSTEIYLDIPLEWLGQEAGQKLISEMLLASSRIPKIVNQYKGYTGNLQYNGKGEWRKVIDPEILKEIQYSNKRETHENKSSARDEFLKNLQNIPQNYPTGEVDFEKMRLTPDMNQKRWEKER